MSDFNPETFLNQSIDTELDTRRETIDEGDYPATVEEVKLRKVNFRDGRTGGGVDVMFRIESPEVTSKTGLPSVKVRYSFLLDLTDDGELDSGKGKNLRLGRLREAAGQNKPGQWSFTDLVGAIMTVRVKHRLDENDPTIKYEDVTSVAKAA